MAENKKSIIIYADWIEKFEELTDEEAGKLIKHFFRYVNDMNPEAPDRTTKLMFIDIKNTLKRDLKKYESKKEERSKSGRLGNLKRYNKDLYDKVKSDKLTLEQAEKLAKDRLANDNVANLAVNDSVSDSVSDSDIIDKSITYTKENFLENWNQLRSHYLKTPSNLNKLYREESDAFNDLENDTTKEEYHKALNGLFKQEKVPSDVMRFRPKHFLNNIDTYLDAELNKKYNLYV